MFCLCFGERVLSRAFVSLSYVKRHSQCQRQVSRRKTAAGVGVAQSSTTWQVGHMDEWTKYVRWRATMEDLVRKYGHMV